MTTTEQKEKNQAIYREWWKRHTQAKRTKKGRKP